MAAASWPKSLVFVWRPNNDGQPYHVTQGDAGGATSWGVTAGTWAWARDKGLVQGDLVDASTNDLAIILRSLFWNTMHCDSLPAGVDLCVFNLGMMSGPGRAARWLQSSIGVKADGVIGPITIGATNARNPWDVIDMLTEVGKAFWVSTGQTQFLKGWTRRGDDARAEALKLAGFAPSLAGSV